MLRLGRAMLRVEKKYSKPSVHNVMQWRKLRVISKVCLFLSSEQNQSAFRSIEKYSSIAHLAMLGLQVQI